jgi:hypothetical protein
MRAFAAHWTGLDVKPVKRSSSFMYLAPPHNA